MLNGFSVSAGSWFIGLFALGMAAADIGFSQKHNLVTLRDSLPWGLLACLFTVVAFVTEWKQLGLYIWIGQSFCGLAAACLFIYCTKLVINGKKLPYLLGLFEHSWMVKLGAFSYSLYLIHGLVLVLVRYWLFYLPMSPFMFAAISYFGGTIVSLIIAYLFYFAFERPFMPGFGKKTQS